MTRITILVDNSVHQRGLSAEHGLSVHIWKDGRSILFDCGQTNLVSSNARALGIDLGVLDAIVLSHGHDDHTGGLASILEFAPKAKVFLHPQALTAKYSRQANSSSRFIGMNESSSQSLKKHGGEVIHTPRPAPIADGIFVTGEIPRLNDFEDTGGAFFLDAACTQPDPLLDDQALVIDLGASLLVILGCAHSGIVNTLHHIQNFMAGKPIQAILGGMHLGNANEQRLAKTVEALNNFNLELLAPIHCTGWFATARLCNKFGPICRPASVGARFEYPT